MLSLHRLSRIRQRNDLNFGEEYFSVPSAEQLKKVRAPPLQALV